MLHRLRSWIADGLRCVQSVDQQRIILNITSAPHTASLKLSKHRISKINKHVEHIDCGSTGDFDDMHQLFHVFCRRKAMTEEDKNKARKMKDKNICSALNCIFPLKTKKVWLNNEAAQGSHHRLIGQIGTL